MAIIRRKISGCAKRAIGIHDVLNDIKALSEKFDAAESQHSDEIDQLSHRVDEFLSYSRFYYNNELAKTIHPLLFEKYRDCNKGKELVIVACGPSLDNYKVIKGAKHLVINRAYQKKGIKPDYLFTHDRQLVEECGDEIKKIHADKFIAFATGEQNAKLFNASSEQVASIGAKRFFISDVTIPNIDGGQFDIIQSDITKGLLYDRGGGTVFSSLQFALFTHPKKIYLVGCDCSEDGYFSDVRTKIKQKLLDKTEYLWREAKVFIDQYYPDIEIVSVNPVNLKGLFKDLYQK